MTPETELAWAAGFFDGEGYTGFRTPGGRSYRAIRMSIGQMHREPLDRFHRAVGVGFITGPDPQGMFRWQVNARLDLHRVAALLWHYLGSVKQAQIESAFDRYHAAREERRSHPDRRRREHRAERSTL